MNTAIPVQSCQPWPASGPVTFQPGTCYSFDPHAASWYLTFAGLGWVIAAWLIAGLALAGILNWFTGQYEVAWPGRLPRFTRRWYSRGAHVCLKSGGRNPADPDRFEVLEWGDESTETPWLCVRNIDFAGYADFDPPQASWVRAEDYAPYAVRRFHPVLAARSLAAGHPAWPFWYETLPLSRSAAPRGG